MRSTSRRQRVGMCAAVAVVLAAVLPSAACAESIFGSTEDALGTRVAGVCVEAFSADAGRDAAPVAQTVSDNLFYDGHWSLTVGPGNYKVRFAACGGPADAQFQPSWFDHHSGWGSALTIPVAPGQSRDVGRYALAAAHPMGTITGTLTAPDGSAASGWCAVALNPAGSGFDGSIKTYDITDANGRYTIQYLQTGPWKLFFTTRCGGFSGTKFDEEYYNDKTSFTAADAVTVSDGQTTAGIDATLNWMGGVPPGAIGGVVTVGGAPRAGVCVGALDPATGAVLRGTVSNDDGSYALPYLTRGSYKVVFGTAECPAARGPSLPRMFFSGQADFAAAQEVPVVYSPVGGIDMAYPALAAETVTKTVGPGETVSTDSGTGPTGSDPLVVDATTLQGGTITITETRDPTTTPPAGLRLLDFQIEIDAPPATKDRPLVLTFKLDASAISGLDASRIAPLRDGELAGDCLGSSAADPDPCVSARSVDQDTGDLTLRVNARHASAWNLASVPKRCVVPDLIGMKLAKAKKALAKAKCKLGKVKEKPSKKKAGTVIAQKPKARAIKAPGAKVGVTVSSG